VTTNVNEHIGTQRFYPFVFDLSTICLCPHKAMLNIMREKPR